MYQVVKEMRRHVGTLKEKLLEKLAAANFVPIEALENTRLFLETMVRDVTSAAHGLTMDAVSRIKSGLVGILLSLSPAFTRKMVDDAAKEADEDDDQSEGKSGGDHQKGEEEDNGRVSSKAPYSSPTSSFFASLKPLPRL